MQIETKYLDRRGWSRITSRRDAYLDLKTNDFTGIAGLIRMDSVTAPLDKTVAGTQIRLVDEGYSWMQIAPENENWWLTVMIDRTDGIVQYYIDVTLENIIRGRDSYFRDLFLDVAVLPEGAVELLDRDELDEALAECVITEKEYRLAVETAEMMIKELPEHWAALHGFCMKTYQTLRKETEL